MSRKILIVWVFIETGEIPHIIKPFKKKFKFIAGPLRTMACGALAGVSLWIAVFPTDVVKSRVQVQSSDAASFFGTLTSVFRNEGNRLNHVFILFTSNSI